MPLTNLLSLTVALFVAAVAYAFRNRVIDSFKRFEARNAARRAEEVRALFDRYAHYRQTIQIAEEQVEAVMKITVPDARAGQPVERYLFLGVQYATRAEAEAARYAEVIGKARDFYIDLDRAWLPRRWWREPMAPALPDPKKQNKFTPPPL